MLQDDDRKLPSVTHTMAMTNARRAWPLSCQALRLTSCLAALPAYNGRFPAPSGANGHAANPGHQRPALRQRPYPHRPPGRVPADRYLGPVSEAARAAVHLSLRR